MTGKKTGQHFASSPHNHFNRIDHQNCQTRIRICWNLSTVHFLRRVRAEFETKITFYNLFILLRFVLCYITMTEFSNAFSSLTDLVEMEKQIVGQKRTYQELYQDDSIVTSLVYNLPPSVILNPKQLIPDALFNDELTTIRANQHLERESHYRSADTIKKLVEEGAAYPDYSEAVFDDCDEVRRKIYVLAASKVMSKGRFARAIKLNPKTVREYMARSGPNRGLKSNVFHRGYLYFEKLRLAVGEPKSKQRLDNELLYPAGIPHQPAEIRPYKPKASIPYTSCVPSLPVVPSSWALIVPPEQHTLF